MQGLGFIALLALLWACHPKVRNESVTAEAGPSSPGTADLKPVNKTCKAVRTPARLLSETGCVQADKPAEPATGMVAYDVIAPLWSDSSQKQRFVALPEGEVAKVLENGHVDLPVGSVTMKIFALGGRPIETRLFMRESSTSWKGYSYAWRIDGSDAELLDDGKEVVIDKQTWVYPSRQQCNGCHNQAAGITLGLTTDQLQAQLVELRRAGVVAYEDAAIKASALIDYRRAGEPIEARARSYLHGNCAYCHQPKGGGIGSFDFRIQNDFKQLGICNTVPMIQVFDVTDGRIFKPGVPSASYLILRMKDMETFHMPPGISRVLDKDGVALMEQWTFLRTSCE